MSDEPDTIAALATPTGGAVAIVRTSGPRAREIAKTLGATDEYPHPCPVSTGGTDEGTHPWHPARATNLNLGGVTVAGKVLSFITPRSSTGEDVVEYHLPGSPWLVSRLLERLFTLGARQAEPGEFTSRAFLNGKLDLASAEGVVATIGASNRAGLDAARRLLAGELSNRLRPIMDRLADALALVEVGIDFSEEDVSFIARDRLVTEIAAGREALQTLAEAAPSLERLDHEPCIVLAGRPNAGKSSLLNALADRQRAVVADVAGTTRDALSARVALPSGYVTMIDVAGLDEASGGTSIDAAMRVRALRAIEEADHVVLVVPADDERPLLSLARPPDLVVRSKSDLYTTNAAAGLMATTRQEGGLDAFRAALDALVFAGAANETSAGVALNVRQRAAIADASAALDRGIAAVDRGAEFVASELRQSLDALGRVLGRVAPDDVLGRIFSSFCIGK